MLHFLHLASPWLLQHSLDAPLHLAHDSNLLKMNLNDGDLAKFSYKSETVYRKLIYGVNMLGVPHT